VRFLLLALVLAGRTAAGAAGETWPEPPFEAELGVASAYVREGPNGQTTPVGLLVEGDRVRVTGCEPSCAAEGWALLGGDGAIRLRHLRPPGPVPPPERHLHGTVRRGGAPVHAAPDEASEVLSEVPARWVLSFLERPELLEREWLARPRGGFVRASRVRLERPSTLSGERDPGGPIAFFRRKVRLPASDGEAPRTLGRYARLPALGMDAAGRVRVEGGAVERSAVRLAFARPPPPRLPSGTRWVHVDLAEQVLTAYEGERWVYATLVSTGSAGRETLPGRFRVIQKLRHGDMCSRAWGYHVEEVPDVLYFREDQGFHGTFWHDAFGAPVSHGCVNLAPADAAWLFAWAPPRLPDGWHAVMPHRGQESLWVVVERSGPAWPTARPEPDPSAAR